MSTDNSLPVSHEQERRRGGGKEDGSGVRFGGVRVHTHKMILGDNPGGRTTTGPPVTLNWDVEASEQYSTIDGFAREYYGRNDSLRPSARIISGTQRREIAAADNSDDVIEEVQKQVRTIRNSRGISAHDPHNLDILEEEKEGKKKKGGRRFGRLVRSTEKKSGGSLRMFGQRK